MSALSDAIITYAIIRKFTTPIKDTKAFQLGLIDDNGYPTYKATHDDSEVNRDAYTLLDRLVFKLKRTFKSMPAFTKLVGGYAAALAFIKESVDYNEFEVFEHLDNFTAEYWGSVVLGESVVPFEAHVVIQIAENETMLARLVEAYERGLQDVVCEDMAVAVSADGGSGNSVSSGQVQGLATEPVISAQTQKKWTLKNRGRKIEEILP